MTPVIGFARFGPSRPLAAYGGVVRENAGTEQRPGGANRLIAARRYTKKYNAISMVMLGLPPVISLLVDNPPPALWVALLAGIAAISVLHASRLMVAMREPGRPLSVRRSLATLAFALAVWCLGVCIGPTGFIWCFLVGSALGDVVIGRPWRAAVGWILGTAVVTGLTGAAVTHLVVVPESESKWLTPILGAIMVCFVWATDADRMWWFRSVVDLDESRRTADELATARERLRIADDLHDILGHALEVVAFKSELAARLVTVDAARAEAEMDEVQKVARTSLSEVRSLVQERRPTDLVTELAGARAVLGSAGITAIVSVEPAGLPVDVRNVLGRVLREAMTNLLRQPSRLGAGSNCPTGTERPHW